MMNGYKHYSEIIYSYELIINQVASYNISPILGFPTACAAH